MADQSVIEQLMAGKGSDMVPQDLIVEAVIGPLLAMMVGDPFLMRMTIETRLFYQIDVLRVVGYKEGEGDDEPVEAFTFEAYKLDAETPSGRDQVFLGFEFDNYWHETPLEAFKAGVGALETKLAKTDTAA